MLVCSLPACWDHEASVPGPDSVSISTYRAYIVVILLLTCTTIEDLRGFVLRIAVSWNPREALVTEVVHMIMDNGRCGLTGWFADTPKLGRNRHTSNYG